MEADDIYKYLGLLVVVVFVVFIVIKTMNFQLQMVEGFGMSKSQNNSNADSSTTDKDKVSEAIKNNTDKISDSLLTSKYLRAYEDTILQLDSNIDMYILSEVLKNAESISTDPSSDSNQEIITKLNNAKAFSDVLNRAMQILDKT